MKRSNTLVVLACLVALLAIIYAIAGLFSHGGDGPFNFTTLHGATVEMYGQGLYRYDFAFKAPILRGTDAVTLFVCVPALLVAVFLYRRGSVRGGLLLTSMLAYFLYNAASLGFGAAYNNLMIVYIVSFSTSLFAFMLAITSIDLKTSGRTDFIEFSTAEYRIFLVLRRIIIIHLAIGNHRRIGTKGRPPEPGSLYDRSDVYARPGHYPALCLSGRDFSLAPRPIRDASGCYVNHGKYLDRPGSRFTIDHAGIGWDHTFSSRVRRLRSAVHLVEHRSNLDSGHIFRNISEEKP